MPIANLIGVEGWRLPSFIQIQANTGAKITMNNGFRDWNHEDSRCMPAKESLVR